MAIDLQTNYGGLILPSPIVVGASPMTAQESTRIALTTAGAGAIVLPSLHQEEVLGWRATTQCDDVDRDKDSPIIDAESYLGLVRRAVTGSPIPIIASLNGTTANQWVDFASQLEDAGAHAIELNIHRTMPQLYDGPREIEETIVQSVILINQAVEIPVFVKVGREFTSVSHLATKLLSGANAMVLHGRCPDVDICLDDFGQTVSWGLSSRSQLGQTLASLLRVHQFCPAMPLAACGGISESSDVIKVLLSGAEVAMVVSAMYREGTDVIRQMVDGLRSFLEQKHLTDLDGLRELRPKSSSPAEQRQDYKSTLAASPDRDTIFAHSAQIKGDRFGHPE